MKLHEIKLLEAPVGNSPDFHRYEMEEGLELIKSKCKDGLKLFLEGKGFYRSDINFRKLDEDNVWTVDPSKTERRSQNTTNQYTEIFDNHPEMKTWPKRSRSYIASTSEARASRFSGAPRALIPFDGVKIGFVNAEDLWDSEIELFGNSMRITSYNGILEHLGIETFKDVKRFDKELKDKSEAAIKLLDTIIHLYAHKLDNKKYYTNFYDEILKAYSPEAIGFTTGTTSNLPEWNKRSEVWIGGPCIVLSEKVQGILTGRIK